LPECGFVSARNSPSAPNILSICIQYIYSSSQKMWTWLVIQQEREPFYKTRNNRWVSWLMILINNSQILGCVIVGLVGHYFARSSPLFFTVK
jgi:hypothetical protein